MQANPGNMGDAQAADAPLPTGRLLTYSDITPTLKGRQAEVQICLRYAVKSSLAFMPLTWLCMSQLYWPDDKMWYLIEVAAINVRTRIAK